MYSKLGSPKFIPVHTNHVVLHYHNILKTISDDEDAADWPAPSVRLDGINIFCVHFPSNNSRLVYKAE